MAIWVIVGSHHLFRYSLILIWVPLIELAFCSCCRSSFWPGAMILSHSLIDSWSAAYALVLRALALVVDGGKPIALGLSALSRHYPTRWVRRRLVRASSDVQGGADWIESLSRHRLIRAADADALSSAAETESLPLALIELAEAAERRLVVRFQVDVQALFRLAAVIHRMAAQIVAAARAARADRATALAGRIRRAASLAEFYQSLASLLERGLPMPEALRRTGEGVQDADIEASCRLMPTKLRRDCRSRKPWKKRDLFPAGFPRLMMWAENQQSLPEALHIAHAMFESRVRSYATLVATILNVICVLLTFQYVLSSSRPSSCRSLL